MWSLFDNDKPMFDEYDEQERAIKVPFKCRLCTNYANKPTTSKYKNQEKKIADLGMKYTSLILNSTDFSNI